MTDLNVTLKLDRIVCRDEGDGPGNAEPYLWSVFFKLDGETMVVNSDGPAPPFVQGFPTVAGTPGNHGNLGNTDVDEGDTVPIPAIIGEFHTVLKPIPLTTPIGSVAEVGGVVGCIVVLMEEDETPSAAIQRGHESFDRNVRDRLAEAAGSLSFNHPTLTEAEVQALSDRIGDAVRDSIADGVSVLDWIFAFGNMDDQIGSAVFFFSHDQLQGMNGAPIPFGRRWRNEGDWEILGAVTAIALPRTESPCCRELRGRVKELEQRLRKQDGRLAALEAAAGRRLEPPRRRAGAQQLKAAVREQSGRRIAAVPPAGE